MQGACAHSGCSSVQRTARSKEGTGTRSCAADTFMCATVSHLHVASDACQVQRHSICSPQYWSWCRPIITEGGADAGYLPASSAGYLTPPGYTGRCLLNPDSEALSCAVGGSAGPGAEGALSWLCSTTCNAVSCMSCAAHACYQACSRHSIVLHLTRIVLVAQTQN